MNQIMAKLFLRALRPHPRLIFSNNEWSRLSLKKDSPLRGAAQKRVAAMANEYLQSTVFEYPLGAHNAHLIRARIMQTRILTLLVQWRITGDKRFQRAAVAHVLQMGRWKYWSWIAWRSHDHSPAAVFDLSYGENAATLALAWDCLRHDLTETERHEFIAIAQQWPFNAFFNNGRRAPKHWWMTKADSNWLSVCAGGLGMLCLAMSEAIPKAARALELVEKAMESFIATLDKTSGGWTEGIGYWGYGMRYAFWYLLSWEHAFGAKHPLMRLRGVARTVDFPLDFTPNNLPCSFGDVNSFGLHPIQYALAERLKRPDILSRVDAFAKIALSIRPQPQSWPTDAELLLLRPCGLFPKPQTRKNVLRHYQGMDWFSLADRWPFPEFYVSIRGGTTETPHGHLDLLSFNAVVGKERLICNFVGSEYLDTTFSPRRYELPEMTPFCKNTLLINGLGIKKPAQVSSRVLSIGRCWAIRMDATKAMAMPGAEKSLRFCGRLFLWLEACGLLILDAVDLAHYGRVESRLHTPAGVAAKNERAVIHGKQESLTLTFASTVPCEVCQAAPAMTSPGQNPLMIRWRTRELRKKMALAVLLTPGKGRSSLLLTELNKGIQLKLSIAGKSWLFKFTQRLFPQLPSRDRG